MGLCNGDLLMGIPQVGHYEYTIYIAVPTHAHTHMVT